jgi:hypothetical protein
LTFLRSLAEDQQENAIGIILSGARMVDVHAETANEGKAASGMNRILM